MLPRQYLTGDLVHVTRLCAGKLARLRPSPATDQLVTYCLARAARRHQIDVLAFCVLSTHIHLILRDPKRRLPFFCQELFSNIARALNVQQSTNGAVFIQGSYGRPVLETPEALYKAFAYVLANPVAAGCVREPAFWPGLITLPEDLGRRTYTARRPDYFFRDPAEEEGALTGDESARERHRLAHSGPEEVREADPMRDVETLTLALPPILPDGSSSDRRADEVRRGVVDWLGRELEVVHAERRQLGLTAWLGVHLVKAQDPMRPCRERGKGGKATGTLNPRFATQSRRVGEEKAKELAAWLELHATARMAWSSGDRTAVFPVGTWLAPLRWGATAVPEPAPARAHPA